jgi:hypothetical protein
MDIQPAHISQVVAGADGRVYEISADMSTVAADLQEIDKGLKVRFSERGECFIIRHDWHPGCQHNGDVGEGGSYLVKTVRADRNRSGTFTGLDQRVVDRIRYIHPTGRSGYDFVAELDRKRARRERREKHEFAESLGEAAERTAHALRKDLGLGPYKGRVFKPREIKPA